MFTKYIYILGGGVEETINIGDGTRHWPFKINGIRGYNGVVAGPLKFV